MFLQKYKDTQFFVATFLQKVFL